MMDGRGAGFGVRYIGEKSGRKGIFTQEEFLEMVRVVNSEMKTKRG
jgi:hypothetical protein